MICDAPLPLLVRGGASFRPTGLLASLPVSDGLGPFQQCPASEISRRLECDGWQSVDSPHNVALWSDDGGKSPSWLGLEVPEKRRNIEVIQCTKQGIYL
jgi:hypothetical protein